MMINGCDCVCDKGDDGRANDKVYDDVDDDGECSFDDADACICWFSGSANSDHHDFNSLCQARRHYR